MNKSPNSSWGRFPPSTAAVSKIKWRSDDLPRNTSENRTYLPFGNGRSYGDVCLNNQGVLIDTKALSRFISFDDQQGYLRCEAGVLLSDVLRLIIPKGWFLPVTPGTQFVTVGGAIANDIHGKNHHRAGTFGCHVRSFELVRSSGERMTCTPDYNSDWFKATIGGLGLTGLIIWAELQLLQISSTYMRTETLRIKSLSHLGELVDDSDHQFEYTASWIDCLAPSRKTGRGVFYRSNFCDKPKDLSITTNENQYQLPFSPGRILFNQWTLSGFNFIYLVTRDYKAGTSVQHFQPSLYPLDRISNWNIAYGKNGFLQYQCVVPMEDGFNVIREVLQRIARARIGSFLSVLKIFGRKKSPGILSFPRHGISLTLDFPLYDSRVFKLLDELDQSIIEAGGAVYPAKDARMSSEAFFSFFPQWAQFEPYIDPNFSSDFLLRVTGRGHG